MLYGILRSKFPYLCAVLPSIFVCYGQLTEIRSCSENGSRTDVAQFVEFSRLELCCFLGKVDCTEATQGGRNLMLLPKNESQCGVGDFLSPGGDCSRYSQRIDDCSVKYVISNASIVTEGDYFCIVDEKVKFTSTVTILEKPVPVVIISFSFSIQSRLIVVQFDPGPRVTKYHDDYDVRLVRVANPSDRFVMCNETSTVCPVSGQTCSCTYQASERILVETDSVMVVVTITRGLIVVETAANFTIAAHIIPGPIMRMKMVETGPHSGTLQFCMNQATKDVYRFMSKSQAHLIFHLWVLTTQDVLEILNVTFTVVAPVSVVDGSDYKCMCVNLPGLMAFTNYTAIVSASGGGGMGQRSKVDFTTGMTVPAYSPVIEEYDFSRLDKVDSNGSTFSVLAIWWQPLPHEAVGGSDLSYHVEVLSSSGEVLLNQSSQDTLVIIRSQDLPSTLISATITAQNRLGSAQQISQLVIPQKRDYNVPYVIVELNGDTALVYINQTDLARDTMLSVHWCRDFIDDHIYGFPVCQEYPLSATFPVKVNSRDVQKFHILLISKKNQPEEMSDSRALNYSYYCYLNKLARKKGIANATVTRYPSESLDYLLNSDFYVDRFDEIYDMNYYYYDYWRRKRDIDDVIAWYREDGSSQRKFLYETSSDMLGLQDIRVFWSLRMGGTSGWNTGLVPSNCYFDKKKGAGKPELIVSYSKKGDFIILSWKQECRKDSPAQFLADYFMVFSSNVVDCVTDRQFQGKVNNSIFESSTLQLPGDTKFVCIQTCRYLDYGQTECSSTPAVTAINGFIESEQSYNLIIAVTVSVVFAVACGIIFCLYKCWKRGSAVKHYLHDRLHITSQEVRDEQFDSAEDITALETTTPPDRNQLQQTSADSFDSGRGTDTENTHNVLCCEMEVVNSTEICRPIEHFNKASAGPMIASNLRCEEVATVDVIRSGCDFKPTRSTDISSPHAADFDDSDTPGSNHSGPQLSSTQECGSHSTNSHPSNAHSSEHHSSQDHIFKARNFIFSCSSESNSDSSNNSPVSDSQDCDSPSAAHSSQSPNSSSSVSAAQDTTNIVLFNNSASSSSSSSKSPASDSHGSESHSSSVHFSRIHHLDSSPNESFSV